MAQKLTSEDFTEQVINSSETVLVDFYSDGCGPCRRMAPVVDELAKEMEGTAKVYKVDVMQAMDLAEKYRIMSIPTFMVFKGGEVKEQLIGMTSKDVLKQKINNV